jgi:protein-disulfide isomerase
MTTEDMAHLSVPVGARDHIHGAADAPVTLVEYGDYECPYCGQAFPIVKAVQQRLGDRLRFVFRNFPLTQVHPHAEHAAEVAEAAAAQGKFWEMHDYLFLHQQALDDEHLGRYARAVGLDMPVFEQAMAAHAYAPRVREDVLGGVRSGVNGTPTFFINGMRFEDSWDEESLSSALEAAVWRNAGRTARPNGEWLRGRS